MKRVLHFIAIGLISLICPVVLVYDSIQIMTGSKEGSIATNGFYLLAWCVFIAILFWLIRQQQPNEKEGIMLGKRTQSARYLQEIMSEDKPGDD